jgi:hypothetical protein
MGQLRVAIGAARAGGRDTEVLTVLGDHVGLADSDSEWLASWCATQPDVRLWRVSLGQRSLLASHCIVLLHHYMDLELHACDCESDVDDATSTNAVQGASDVAKAEESGGLV